MRATVRSSAASPSAIPTMAFVLMMMRVAPPPPPLEHAARSTHIGSPSVPKTVRATATHSRYESQSGLGSRSGPPPLSASEPQRARNVTLSSFWMTERT